MTGRRCGEVLNLRLDCLGRYGGLPMLWHDQTKVGNYDAAIRIPERVYQLLEDPPAQDDHPVHQPPQPAAQP